MLCSKDGRICSDCVDEFAFQIDSMLYAYVRIAEDLKGLLFFYIMLLFFLFMLVIKIEGSFMKESSFSYKLGIDLLCSSMSHSLMI